VSADIASRFDRLDAFIAHGALVRHEWGDGQERACLLLAIAPEVGAGNVAACPAAVLPRWLAELTPSIDDNGSEEAWPSMVRRYSTVVRRGAEQLDAAGWRRVLARFLIATMEESGAHDTSGSCERVAGLWRRVLAGDEPAEGEWAAEAAVAAEARAAAAGEWAARAATAAARAATAAAEAEAAAAWAAAARAALAATDAAAWDRLTTALLDAIELEAA
jgi:hypothetical protein